MRKKTALISPLNWGLGHASRMIPVIKKLILHNFRVIVASDGLPLILLQREFPDFLFMRIDSLEIKYGKSKSQLGVLLYQIPKFILSIRREHFTLKKIIAENDVDIIISDNRYGFWHPDIKSIFVTHQINIISPINFKLFNKLIFKINRWLIKRFTEIWIPDYNCIQSLAGILSDADKLKLKHRYIGCLSKFWGLNKSDSRMITNDILIILSGPESQRTVLESMLIKQVSETSLKTILVRGRKSDRTHFTAPKNIEIISMADSKQLFKLYCKSELIICRSGYSSIMDLACLGKKAVLIPTPGQSEQEYLAAYHKQSGHFYSIHQSEFNLETAIHESQFYTGIKLSKNDLLTFAIQSL